MLIRLIENWKQSLDNQKFVGAVLMDLSKAFNCIPHNLLIAKMHVYGFSIDSFKIFFTYLKGRKKYEDKVLLFGFSQGSTLGLILFNIFYK